MKETGSPSLEMLNAAAALPEQSVGERTRGAEDGDERLRQKFAGRSCNPAEPDLDEQRLQALLELSRMTGASEDELIEFSLKEAVRLSDSEIGYIALMNEDDATLTMRAWYGSAVRECEITDYPAQYPVEKTGLWGELVLKRRPVITNDCPAPSPFRKEHPEAHIPVRRHLGIPVLDDDGCIVAVLGVGNKHDDYDESDVRQLALLMQGMSRIVQSRKAEEILCQSEAKFRLLAEKMRDVIWQTTPDDLVFTYISPSCEQMSGYTQGELIGTSMFDLLSPDTPPHIVRRIRNMMARVRETGTSANPVFELETRRKDGTVILVEVLPCAILDKDGNLEGFQGVTRDITERRRAEEERKRLEAHLLQSQKMESIGTMAGGIAHDFNNILSAVIGFAELARCNAGDPEKVEKNLGEVLKASERARDLVSRILAFSSKTEPRYSPVDLGAVVREFIIMLRPILPSTIEIRHDLSDSCMVMADPTQIQQVIMNLCSNAADAMEKTCGVIEVSLGKVSVKEVVAVPGQGLSPGSYVKLSVKDTGHGMSPEVVARIYDPYFTTKGVGRGTGLGLAVAHGVVKSHGGSIACTSVPGEATTFDVYLPAIVSGENHAESRETDHAPTGTGRILFVDDEPTLVALAGEMLGSLGYETVAKTSSAEALALFSEDPAGFDLVITDMTMPGMTGDRLARELMRIRRDIRIIICTGHSDHFSENDARDLGISEYLMKPLDLATLAGSVRKVLDRG